MKIKSIFDICKKNQRIFLFEKRSTEGSVSEQWISDGSGTFLAEGFPYLDKDTLMAFFDVSEVKREDWQVFHNDFPTTVSFDDASPEEKVIEAHNITIQHGKKTLQTLHTSEGITFIDTEYLKPISDIRDSIEFYERRTITGQLYIVAKAGMMIQAVIMPFEYLNKTSIAQLEMLLNGCQEAYKKQSSKNFYYAQGEMVRIDFQTGEVVEQWEDGE